MGLLDGALGAVFGAAFAAVFRDGLLLKTQETDTGAGHFTAVTTPYAVKLSLDSFSVEDRAATGLPLTAVRMTVLRTALPVAIDLDDGIATGGATYRVVKVDADPAEASWTLAAVPA